MEGLAKSRITPEWKCHQVVHRSIGCSALFSKDKLQQAQMHSLQMAVHLSSWSQKPSAPNLASMHTYMLESICLSQPKHSVRPIRKLVFTYKLPDATTSSQEDSHICSEFFAYL
eukprot:1160314-Pelagomonas_calceolata.AAC.4